MPKWDEITPEIIKEALLMIDEGKTDVDISASLGIQTRFLRRIRDQNNRPRSSQWAHLELTSEQMNDIIDLIREGSTLTQISEETGVARRRIKNFREEEIRSGNLLPEIKKEKSVTQKYSDEELIGLAFINPGYGFDRFTRFLGVRRNFVMDLFLQFKEALGDGGANHLPFSILWSGLYLSCPKKF